MATIAGKASQTVKQIPKDIVNTASDEMLKFGKTIVSQTTNSENTATHSQNDLSQIEQQDEEMKAQRLRLIHAELEGMGVRPQANEPGPLLDPFGEQTQPQNSLQDPFARDESLDTQPEVVRQARQKADLGRNMKG